MIFGSCIKIVFVMCPIQLFSPLFSHRVPAVLKVSIDGDVKTYPLAAYSWR